MNQNLFPNLLHELSHSPNLCLHVAATPGAGKNEFLTEILSALFDPSHPMTEILYYCDTHANYPTRLWNKWNQNVRKATIATLANLKHKLELIIQDDRFQNTFFLIDSISDLFQKSLSTDFREYQTLVKEFGSQIIPLLLEAQLNQQIHFILIHHFAYKPSLDCQFPVQKPLMDLLPGIWVYLRKMPCSSADYNAWSYSIQIIGDSTFSWVPFDAYYSLTPHFMITQN